MVALLSPLLWPPAPLCSLLPSLLLLNAAAAATALPPQPWRWLGPPAPGAALPALTIGLRRARPELLAARLLEVSDPRSASYGRYLSVDEVAALAAPAPTTVRAVTDWLRGHGLEPRRSRGGDYLELTDAPVAAVAAALGAEFFEYEAGGRVVHRAPAGAAALPPKLREHVDGIFPLRVLPPRRRSHAVKSTELAQNVGPL
jgi:tripeptidyl-peptidase-1